MTTPRPRLHRLLAFVPALAVIVSPLSPATAADDSSSSSVTFSVQPADRDGPDGRPNFAWGLTPGARVKDRVALVNYSPDPLPLSVHVADALNTADGGFGLAATGEKPRDLGSWIRLKDFGRNVVVPPAVGSQPGVLVSRVTVATPDQVAPGDHAAGIMAVLTSADTDGQARVRLEQRVATRVYARIAGEADPRIEIAGLSASYHQSWNPFAAGSATVTYTVANTGNINLSVRQLVQTLGAVLDARVAVPDIDILLPGSSVPVTATVDGVWPQVWMTAEVQATPGDLVTGEREYPVVTASTSFWAVSWVWVLIVLLMGLAAAAWWWRSRGLGDPTETPEPESTLAAA